MGCGGSKAAIEKINAKQEAGAKQMERMFEAQQKALLLQTEQLNYQRQQQNITAQQFEEEKKLLQDQVRLLEIQNAETLRMSLLAKQQTEDSAVKAAQEALRQAELMRRNITPPPKPGKINKSVQTDRSIPPNAVMKRRKKLDEFGNVIPNQTQDHREECGGVGTEAVPMPTMILKPVMVAKEIARENEDDDPEYEYHYEYQYQYEDLNAKGATAGPDAVVRTAESLAKTLAVVAGDKPAWKDTPVSLVANPVYIIGKKGEILRKTSKNTVKSGYSDEENALRQPQFLPAQQNLKPADDEEYEYEEDDEDD